MAFANQLHWDYCYGPDGTWTTKARHPKPEYAHRCFVLAGAVKKFFVNARFDPSEPKVGEDAYRELVRKVVRSNPRKPLPEERKITIPGYADLRSFSREQERILKAGCGRAWNSYVQRGHWRMVMPVTRRHQEKQARNLLSGLVDGQPRVLHVYRFPNLSINHGVVAYAATQIEGGIEFAIYDPNYPGEPAKLFYRGATRKFDMPPNQYYRGGPLSAYEVFHRWNY